MPTISIEATVNSDCTEFTIKDSSDYTDLPGGVSDLDSADLEVYKPNSNLPDATLDVLTEIKNGTDITVDAGSGGLGGSTGDTLADGVWQFILKVEDTDTSTTAQGDDRVTPYCKSLNCVLDRVGDLPDMFYKEDRCFELGTDEAFMLYLQLQSSLANFDAGEYTDSQNKIDSILRVCDFNCGCK